jgi:hypothetical protein
MLCPLCRREFPGFAYFQEHPQNKIVLSLRELLAASLCMPVHLFSLSPQSFPRRLF